MTSSLFGSKSKVNAEGGGSLQAVKSVTVPGKCSAISDGDWTVFPYFFLTYNSLAWSYAKFLISRDPVVN
jgi:hypothetical protein